MGPELPGIDTTAGLRLCGDAALYQRMLQMFVQTQADFGVRFEAALSDADPQAALRCAHNLKGSAGYIGAKAVAAAAGELEQTCRKATPPKRRALLYDNVIRELGIVLAGLAQ